LKNNNISFKRNTFKIEYFKDENLVGAFDFPMIDKVEKQNIERVSPFNIFKSNVDNGAWVHFFIDDYQFERLWQNPTQFLKLLSKAKGIITTDFSMYQDMPKAMQIYNCYRNRALARYFQTQGLNIIPAVGWSDADSLKWCFEGIAKGSTVAISTNGCMQNKEALKGFLTGFNRMLEELDPCQIILVGRVPEELRNNDKIKCFANYSQTFANLTKER